MTYGGPPFGYTVPAGYTFDNISKCSSCAAPIMWCLTRKGNRAPLNPDGISHFATCPNAADHRRTKASPPPPPIKLPAVPDPAAGTAAREEAIERVDAGTPVEWRWMAARVLTDLAATVPDLTTDDLFFAIQAAGFDPSVPEMRAYGAVIRRGQADGVISPTDHFRPSVRPAAHRRPMRVHRSLIMREAPR